MAKKTTKSVVSGKVAVYIRVSTSGQSLESQKAVIENWLKGHGLEATWYSDKTTGTTFNRPGFNQLQADIFNGLVDTVVIYKLDRLSRTMVEGLNVLQAWLDKGIRLVSVTQQMDFSGALGKTLAGFLLGISEMEMEVRRERQADGIAIAKAAGVYKGRKEGSRAYDLGRMLEMKAKGLSNAEIATALGCNIKTVQRAVKENAQTA